MTTEHYRLRVRVDEREYEVEVEDLQANPVIARVEGKTYRVFVEPSEQKGESAAAVSPVVPSAEAAAPPPTVEAAAPGAITAPMPGDVVEVKVQVGDQVQAGDPVCVLDAMKMKNVIYAPQAGRVVAVSVTAGQAVDYGDVLVRLA
ncbi:MAG: biotin/lipoyl-binding protein [Anaerolineae bacterium]|nr:MAG: biotin/lipoyl-binding protein [Anaerolineae bacterium]